MYIEDEENHDADLNDKKESEANEFSANCLIDPADYLQFIRAQKRISKVAIKQFAADLNIAPGIVVGRLQHDGHLPYTHCNELKQTLAWAK